MDHISFEPGFKSLLKNPYDLHNGKIHCENKLLGFSAKIQTCLITTCSSQSKLFVQEIRTFQKKKDKILTDRLEYYTKLQGSANPHKEPLDF
jgi:hypothetical protein